MAWKTLGYFQGVGIPEPSGPFTVGSVDLMGKLEGDDPQGLLVRLYYPTGASAGEGNGDYPYAYWYPSKNYLKGYLEFTKTRFSGLISTVLSAIFNPMIPALWKAPLLEAGQQAEEEQSPSGPANFPVIVFSHGLGAMRTTYSAITCDLASHGYVVASVGHRDQSACTTLRRVPRRGGADGELEDKWLPHRHLKLGEDEFELRNAQVKQRASEACKTLDLLGLLNEGTDVFDMLGSGYDFKQFKGRLDLSRAVVMGHSFGGATAVLASQEDSRFKCGLGLDSWMLPLYREPEDSVNSSLSQPFYFINAHTFQWKDNVLKMRSLCEPLDASGKSPRRILTLDGTEHMNQCDVFFLAPNFVLDRFGTSQTTTIDNEVAHAINMDICHAFLRRHLLKDSEYEGHVAVLDGGEGHPPMIIFGTNVDLGDDRAGNESEGDSKDSNTNKEGSDEANNRPTAGEDGDKEKDCSSAEQQEEETLHSQKEAGESQ